MASITQARTDLTDIAERLRTVAQALKRMPSDHTYCPEAVESLCQELRAIAAQIRGNEAVALTRGYLTRQAEWRA